MSKSKYLHIRCVGTYIYSNVDESGLCNNLITFSKEVRMRLTCMHKICEWPKPKNVGFPDRAYSLLFYVYVNIILCAWSNARPCKVSFI